MPKVAKSLTCFIAMPITTSAEQAERFGGDESHWDHVMESLFVRAIEAAGFEPLRPKAQGSHLIHGLIIHHLSTADLVLVDLSSHNPNVFFELGVRTSINLPIALIRDEHTSLPFDTSGINTASYDSSLRGWELEDQRDALAQHIRDSYESCAGQNPLWRQFGLTIRASEPEANESPLEAKVDLLTDRMFQLQGQLAADRQERANQRLEAMSDGAYRARVRADRRMLEEPGTQTERAMLEFESELHGVFRNDDEFLLEPESPRSATLYTARKPFAAMEDAIQHLANMHHVSVDIRRLPTKADPNEELKADPGSPVRGAANRDRDRQLGRSRPGLS